MPNILNRHFFTGLLMGLVIPFVVFAIFLQINDWLVAANLIRNAFTRRTLFAVSICFNLLPAQQLRRSPFVVSTVQGIVTATLIYAVVYMLYFGYDIIYSMHLFS